MNISLTKYLSFACGSYAALAMLVAYCIQQIVR